VEHQPTDRVETARVLFVAEDITLAQVARPVQLARMIDRVPRYEVHFACRGFDEALFQGTRFARWPLPTVDRAKLLARVRKGRPLYRAAEIAAYVHADTDLLQKARPHLVIGDFRLSLGVSCRSYGVPYAALINAYWHPAHQAPFPMPIHSSIRMLRRVFGDLRARKSFEQALPFVLRRHARGYDRIRNAYSLPSVGDLQHMICDADYLLLPDVPELVPLQEGVPQARYLGVATWSPAMSRRLWAEGLDGDRWVYVTMGSSGNDAMIEPLLRLLEKHGHPVLLSTAGRPKPASLGPNVHVRAMVPGDQASQGARLVICNGGASTAYQALEAGVPVLGIPANLDQLWFMQCVENAGAGVCHRSDEPVSSLERKLERALSDPRLVSGARTVAGWTRKHDTSSLLRDFVDEVTARPEASAGVGPGPGMRIPLSLTGTVG